MTRPLHVAYFAPAWPPGVGRPNGIVTALGHTVSAMAARGHRVSVVTWDVRAEDAADASTVLRAPSGGAASLRDRVISRLGGPKAKAKQAFRTMTSEIGAAFAALHADDPIDVIEVEESFGQAAAVRAAVPCTVIVRLHGPWRTTVAHAVRPSTPQDAARIEAEAEGIAAADGLTAPAAATLELFRDIQPEGRTAVIYNPLPVDAATSSTASSPKADPRLVAFVGRFDDTKGADIAIDAVAMAALAGTDIRLEMCGPENGIVREDRKLGFDDYLERFVDPSVRERIVNHGTLTRPAVERLRGRAAVVLVSSRHENFPYSVCEAMAQGRAVVASNSYGIAEMIRDGETGLLVPPGDAAATAAALTRLLGDPELRQRLGEAARAWVTDKLAPDALAADTEAFYRHVSAQRSAASR